MTYFVLVYDRVRAAILEREDYGSEQHDVAWTARDRLVRKYVAASNVEVVLLGAGSEADLRATHGRYFEPAASST